MRGIFLIRGANPRKHSLFPVWLLSEVPTLANTHFARYVSYLRYQPSLILILRDKSLIRGDNPLKHSFCAAHLLSEVPTLARLLLGGTSLIGSANPRKYSVCVVHLLSEVPTLANKLFAQYRYISYARCQLPTLVNNDERGGEPILSRYRNII